MNIFLGKEILPFNEQQLIKPAKFTCSPLGKAFEKQAKTIEDQGKKQVDALKPKEVNQKTQKQLIIFFMDRLKYE